MTQSPWRLANFRSFFFTMLYLKTFFPLRCIVLVGRHKRKEGKEYETKGKAQKKRNKVKRKTKTEIPREIKGGIKREADTKGGQNA